jgi:2-succinyl-6-hydroxy-2,4-cyclohexadiene-1-carboxylate synthase
MTPAVLLLHGFTHTGASWDPVLAALGERYRATAPDIRGHGSASGAEPVTLEAVLEDLVSLIGSDAMLAGYSMGGRVALHLALAEPARVAQLVLIGASPGIADPAERAVRRAADERLAAEIDELSLEAFARRWAQTPVLEGLPDDVLARAHADRMRSSPAGLARALRGLGTGALPSLWERLGELAMPVRLVVGARDEKFLGVAQQMARTIRRVDVVVVPRVGHAVHLEAPERVAEMIAVHSS